MSRGIRRHLARRHSLELVHSLDETFPSCELCRKQTNPDVLGQDHKETLLCRHTIAAALEKSLEGSCIAYGEEFKWVGVFKYPSRLPGSQ